MPAAPTSESTVSLAPYLRWAARLGSIASIGFLIPFAFSGGNPPTWGEWLMIAFFPVGVVAGMLVGWKRERLGGAIAVASLLGFYGVALAREGHLPRGPWFVVFAAPGLLFLLCGLLPRRVR